VWENWDTRSGASFSGLHKLIVFQLAHHERWRYGVIGSSFSEVSFDEAYTQGSLDSTLGQADELRQKPNLRLSQVVAPLPLSSVMAGVQKLPWFEQMCAYISLHCTPEYPNLGSYAHFWGIKRESTSEAIDRVIDSLANARQDDYPQEPVWMQINLARLYALLYYPSGKRVEHDNPRVTLLRMNQPGGLSPEEAQVWELATKINGKSLIYSGDDIAKMIGKSPIWVCRKVIHWAEMYESQID
jgi:hypothetical protein